MRRFLLIIILVLLFTSSAFSQLWTGILSNTRAIDWSDKGATVENRTTICATLDPGATASQINTAIAGCSNDGVVYLTTGTYNLTSGLRSKEGVTLRGAGAHLTKLIFTDGVSCNGGYWATICVQPSEVYHIGWAPTGYPSAPIALGGSHTHTWTAGFTRGTTAITLDSVSGLEIGDEIILDQRSDTVDNGEFVVGDAAGVLSLEAGAPGRWLDGTARSQQQYVSVTDIKGNVVTISPGLYASNWDISKAPSIFWLEWIDGFGIEDLTIDSFNSGVSIGVTFSNAKNCWVKNVRLLRRTSRNDIWLYMASHITVTNCYFWGSATSPQAYGVEFFTAGESLIANNIFENMICPIVSGPHSGCVIAHNYSPNSPTGESTTSHTFWAGHDTGAMFNLYEGNQAVGVRTDVFHGPAQALTYFRNRFLGYGLPTQLTLDCAFRLEALNRYSNIIGNVLGLVGHHDFYELYTPTTYSYNDFIYDLGYGNSEYGYTISGDVLVRNTMMRWGNYDVVNDAEPANDGIHWEAGEVPSGLAKYSNAVPSDHILPNSFYLAAAPTYWINPYAVVPWPPIGPDVAGGTGPGGHSNDIPSKLCHDAMVVVGQDPAYSAVTYPGLKLFSGGLCYAANTPPPGDTTAPVITITVPTAAPIYAATVSPVIVSGTASDAVGVTSVTWSALYGQSGTATGTTNWTITSPSLSLAMNTQVLTVTAWDAAGNKGTDILNITYTPPLPGTTTGLRLRIKK